MQLKSPLPRKSAAALLCEM